MFFHSVYFLNKIKAQVISFFILSVTHYKKEKFSYKIVLFHILTKRKYMSPLFSNREITKSLKPSEDRHL